MKGRKPIPAKLVALRGGRQLTHRPPRQDIEVETAMPTCPRSLGKIAREEWRRFCRELAKIGLVGKIDRSIIAIYCREYQTVVEMDALIAKYGYIRINSKTGDMKTNKAVDLRNKATDRMLKAIQELFGSPSSRARNKIEKPKEMSRADLFRGRKNGTG